MRLITLSLFLLLSGCVSEYSGSATTVGEETALPEISNASDTVKVRIFQSIKGARVWTAKDSKVHIKYYNSYTNTYFGIATFSDNMNLDVEIEPAISTTSNTTASNCRTAQTTVSQ